MSRAVRLCLAAIVVIAAIDTLPPAAAQSSLSETFAATNAPFSPAERAGREIWMFATAGNARFHTYVFPQRLGAAIDWYGVLNAKDRPKRFNKWGLINSPDCCTPGTPDCPARSLEETYGFDWCRGDDELLQYVGKTGYRDPACDLEDRPWNPQDIHGAEDVRESSCGLAFGTSTGALGFRKFPNPRFDPDRWQELNGSTASWAGYRQWLAGDPEDPDSRANRLMDGSIEPPYLFGMACGGCHIAFDPLNPPADPAAPEWDNVKALVGNQYLRISEILASGMPKSSLEWQIIASARPGTVDTSAIPNDGVTNPGTMNAIINFGKRPTHEAEVLRWRKVAACPTSQSKADERSCWCEPGKGAKCWERSLQTEQVPHVLKGGEDSIGFNEAVQRVYFNIGSCSEQCWINHIPDLRQADPDQRNYGQTPFDIGQCRRECPNLRAVEDRLDDVVQFLLVARPTDLYVAKGFAEPRDLEVELEAEFGAGAIDRGRAVFAATCARCHSSQAGPFDAGTDFHAPDATDPTLRADWLSNDELMAATEVGTYHSRALHSNHMTSRVWQEYGSETLRAKPAVQDLDEIRKAGGRGYYRNISLLSAWAHAPFLHNNAIGPELCGAPDDPAEELYVSPYVTDDGKRHPNPPACWPYDPSVEGRFELFRASMDLLLNPDRRVPKVRLSDELIVDLVPEMHLGDHVLGVSLRIPPGVPQAAIGNLRHKELLRDIVLIKTQPEAIAGHYDGLLEPAQLEELKAGLEQLTGDLRPARGSLVEGIKEHWGFIGKYYANSASRIENAGHAFGENLSDQDKQALIAFLATL